MIFIEKRRPLVIKSKAFRQREKNSKKAKEIYTYMFISKEVKSKKNYLRRGTNPQPSEVGSEAQTLALLRPEPKFRLSLI